MTEQLTTGTSRRMPLWRILMTTAVATAAVLSVACIDHHGAGYVSFTQPIGSLRGSAKESAFAPSSESAARNVIALADYRHFETPFYHSSQDPDGRPQHCLALSGGGVRAASYSIGVLQGLAERDKLRSIDVLSGVSGGAYTLSWYYLQQWNEDVADTQPGSFPSYGKDRVLENSSAWYPVLLRTLNPLDVFRRAFARSLMAISDDISRIADGSYHITNSGFAVDRYGKSLAKIYHDSPLQEKNPTLYEMADFIHQRHLPLFVINTTVKRFDRYRNEKETLWAGVFEITPRWIGPPTLGHRLLPYFADFGDLSTVRDAVAVSGAAIDGESIKGIGQFFDFMGYSLGRWIEWRSRIQGQIVHRQTKDVKDGFPIHLLYLTDGGHIENLAAYALVR